MALQLTVTLPSELVVTNAYIRILDVRFTKDELVVSTTTWASQAAREAEKPVLARQTYALTWTADPSLTYCYDQLKALPEFAGATDV